MNNICIKIPEMNKYMSFDVSPFSAGGIIFDFVATNDHTSRMLSMTTKKTTIFCWRCLW